MTQTTPLESVETALSQAPDPVDVVVGLNVRRLRKAKGLSQTALGEAVGLTFQQIQKYERGTNRISASKLYGIAQTLGVAAGSFFPTQDAPAAPQSAAQLASVRGLDDLVADYMRLIPRRRLAVRRLIRSLIDSEDELDEAQAA